MTKVGRKLSPVFVQGYTYDRYKPTNITESVRYIMGSSPCRVKPKTIKLVFVASPISTQH